MPYDSTPVGTHLAEAVLTVPDTGAAVDTVLLFCDTVFADTAVLQGHSFIQADNGFQYPFSVTAGAGMIAYYKPNGDVWTRTIDVAFNDSLPGSPGWQLEDLFGATPVPASPLHVEPNRRQDRDPASSAVATLRTWPASRHAPGGVYQLAADPTLPFVPRLRRPRTG